MRLRQLDSSTLERLLDDGLQVKQWHEDGVLHMEISGSWKQHATEVDQRVEALMDLRPFSTAFTGTDPTGHTRLLSYVAVRAASQSA